MDEPIRERLPSDPPPLPSTTDVAEAFAGYLDELARLCGAATPGPWEYADDASAILFGEGHQGGIVCEFPDVAAEATERDALFIVAARHALPKLIAKVRELQAELDYYRDDAGEDDHG